MWHFNTVSKTKCQDGRRVSVFIYTSGFFAWFHPTSEACGLPHPTSRFFLCNGKLKLKTRYTIKDGIWGTNVWQLSYLSKSLEIPILFSRVLTTDLIASANFAFGLLVFKVLNANSNCFTNLLVHLPVLWQTIDNYTEYNNMSTLFSYGKRVMWEKLFYSKKYIISTGSHLCMATSSGKNGNCEWCALVISVSGFTQEV